jgi:phage/plasmid primase-like uncharacterized protein
MITDLETAIDRADLREIIADLYPDAGARPGLTRQRIKAVWRGGDGENVSLTATTAHDFVSGETFNCSSFLVLVAGYSKGEAAAYLLRRAGLDDTPAGQQRVARAALERAARAEQARLAALDEEKRRDADIAAERELWCELPERGRSPYLTRKNLPHVAGMRYQGETLATPLWSATSDFCGAQRTSRDGRKLFTAGARKGGAFTVLGGAAELEGRIDLHNLPRFIAEGVATAVRPQQVYRGPVIVAYDAHNVGAVIRSICAALDAAGMVKQQRAWLRRLVIVADNDQWKAEQLHNGIALGNVGLEAAHRAAFEADRFGVRVACPDFSGLDVRAKPTDFDDLARLAGLDVVRAQLDAAALADPNLVFARRKREHMRDHAARRGTVSPTVDLSGLRDGPNVVKSPQNTQKTRSLIPVAERCRAEGQLFIYVTHRISLAADAARKLGLELYSDYDRGDLSLMGGLAITINSLHHLEDGAGNLTIPHTLVIDESEQAIPALTGAHMTNKAANLRVLSRLVARSQRVVCLDADAGARTKWALSQWRGGERVNWIKNHWEVGEGKTATIYPHRAQPYAQLGSGTFAVTDSMVESRRLAFTLEAQGVKTQLVNGETSHNPENLKFVADIDRYAQLVDAIAGSPSISTGISLTDPNFTRAVGVFYGANGPATEGLQSIWRARCAADWHVWVQPSGGVDQVDHEARYGVTLDAELERSDRTDRYAGQVDFGYADLKRLVAEHNARSRRTYDDDLIWLMVKQGIDVQLAERPTDDEAPALREVLREARDRERTAYADERMSAERYDPLTADKLRAGGTLTSRERYGVERYDHNNYFRNGDTEDLRTWLLADYRGRYRGQLERLEYTLADDEAALTYAEKLLERTEMRADAPLTLTRREFGQRVLAATGLEQAVAALHDELTPDELAAAADWELAKRAYGHDGVDPSPVAARLRSVAVARFSRYSLGSEPVAELLAWVEANREVLAGVVDLPNPDELRVNAVRYIRSWLKTLGLRQHRTGKNARGEYVLDGAALALAAHVFERRGGDTFYKDAYSRKSVPPALHGPDDLKNWLDMGQLDAFGPQKLHVIRQKVVDQDAGWLHRLANSRDIGRMLGVVR